MQPPINPPKVRALKFICLICSEPMVLHSLVSNDDFDILGVQPCKCKGITPEVKVGSKPLAKVFILDSYRKPKNVTK